MKQNIAEILREALKLPPEAHAAKSRRKDHSISDALENKKSPHPFSGRGLLVGKCPASPALWAGSFTGNFPLCPYLATSSSGILIL